MRVVRVASAWPAKYEKVSPGPKDAAAACCRRKAFRLAASQRFPCGRRPRPRPFSIEIVRRRDARDARILIHPNSNERSNEKNFREISNFITLVFYNERLWLHVLDSYKPLFLFVII